MSPGQYEDCTHSQLRNRIQQLEFEKAAITMNLRDEFAKAAMAPIMREACMQGLRVTPAQVAQASYAQADFMLEARK